MEDKELQVKRLNIQMELLGLWNDFRIPQYEVAAAMKMDKTHFSHMIAGRRPALLRKNYDRVLTAMKSIRDERERVTA